MIDHRRYRDIYRETEGISPDDPMITIVLADSALEVVPSEIADHPSVKRAAERRGKEPLKTLLDMSYHYTAMKDLEWWDRRGRPDITFITLLNLLEAPLNKRGLLRVFVHTNQDYIISIDPKTKLPRNYARFCGLMEQLLEEGKVPPRGKPLMTAMRGTLRDLVEQLDPSRTIILTEKGRRGKVENFAKMVAKEDRPLIMIGGFQRGEFDKKDLELADEKVSVYDETLDAWVVASMVVHEVGRHLGLF
jgi:rRNA small subunit pseudouridine methyltransferase Nep1